MTAPSPFSTHIPKLQVAWDSTSLKALMTCPRQYEYSIIEGYRTPGEKVDLDFGGYFASAVERYKKARIAGASKEDATLAAVRYTLEATWTKGPKTGDCPCPDGCNGCEYPDRGGPWGGRYEDMWHCSGSEPYRNAAGNRAKCPWAHKGSWFPAPGPGVCSCGSEVETQRQWISNDKAKDRYTLIRLVVWYCDEQPESLEEGPYPYVFPNGQPAVELSFKIPLPWTVPEKWVRGPEESFKYDAETYLLCGHMDSLMQFGQENFISDNKTTKKALTPSYFAQYSPNIQVATYDLAGSVLYPTLKLKGVMIEAAQTMQEGARFGIGINYLTDKLREEYLGDLRYWLSQAERFAQDDYWPMNRASCYLCQFKSVCSKDPEMRQMYLDSNFIVQKWNPLEER